MIQVLLFHCDRLTSTAVRTLLTSAQDITLLAEVDKFCHASKLPSLRPDVIVMGGRVKPLNGIQQIDAIRHRYPQSRLILLLNSSNRAYISKLHQLPVEGSLLSYEVENSLLHVIRAVAAGAKLVSRAIFDELATRSQSISTTLNDFYLLTRADWKMLELLSQGLDNQQIQSRLQLAASTVRNRISGIYEKLGLHSRAEAVVWYQRQRSRRG